MGPAETPSAPGGPPHPPPTFRDARGADLDRVVAIYNASIPGRRATADTEAVSAADRRAWFEEHGPGPGQLPLIVMEVADELVGWAALSPFYGRPAYAATAEFGLYLDPAWQGRGLGATLLAELLRRAPGAGVSTVLGFVFAHNEASLRLAERAGFERWGRLPGVAELDGRRRDVVILGLALE